MSSAPLRVRSSPPLQHPQLTPYAPVIRRAADEVQVGVDPDAALVFRGAGFAALLDLLDGSRPTSAVRRAARAAGLTAAQVQGALDALASAGLLSERDTTPYADSARNLAVRLIGAGPVGYQFARLLVASGLEALYVYDDEPTDLALYPAAGVLSSRSEALRSALTDAETTVFPLSHWSKPEGVQVDLTVVACDQPEPDRVITDHLLRNDHPHLIVRCWGNGVSVGPLVLAGQTSCLRCADLARSAAEPHWPAVLRQLSRVRTRPLQPRCVVGPPRLRQRRCWRSCMESFPNPLAQRWRSAGRPFVTRAAALGSTYPIRLRLAEPDGYGP